MTAGSRRRRLRPAKRDAIRSRIAGTTLIELMIVVIVVGILASVAIPSYHRYSMRAHRTEAKSALLAVQLRQERFYLDNRTYTNNLAALGLPEQSEKGVYDIDLTAADALTYTATATPKAGGGTNGVDMTTDTECATFTINAQGLRTATGPKCW